MPATYDIIKLYKKVLLCLATFSTADSRWYSKEAELTALFTETPSSSTNLVFQVSYPKAWSRNGKRLVVRLNSFNFLILTELTFFQGTLSCQDSTTSSACPNHFNLERIMERGRISNCWWYTKCYGSVVILTIANEISHQAGVRNFVNPSFRARRGYKADFYVDNEYRYSSNEIFKIRKSEFCLAHFDGIAFGATSDKEYIKESVGGTLKWHPRSTVCMWMKSTTTDRNIEEKSMVLMRTNVVGVDISTGGMKSYEIMIRLKNDFRALIVSVFLSELFINEVELDETGQYQWQSLDADMDWHFLCVSTEVEVSYKIKVTAYFDGRLINTGTIPVLADRDDVDAHYTRTAFNISSYGVGRVGNVYGILRSGQALATDLASRLVRPTNLIIASFKSFDSDLSLDQVKELYNNICGSLGSVFNSLPSDGFFKNMVINASEQNYIRIRKYSYESDRRKSLIQFTSPSSNRYECSVEKVYPAPFLFWKVNTTSGDNIILAPGIPGWKMHASTPRVTFAGSVVKMNISLEISSLPDSIEQSVAHRYLHRGKLECIIHNYDTIFNLPDDYLSDRKYYLSLEYGASEIVMRFYLSERKQVILECKNNGSSPAPTTTIYFEENMVASFKGAEQVTTRQRGLGTYTCVVTNGLGNYERNESITLTKELFTFIQNGTGDDSLSETTKIPETFPESLLASVVMAGVGSIILIFLIVWHCVTSGVVEGLKELMT